MILGTTHRLKAVYYEQISSYMSTFIRIDREIYERMSDEQKSKVVIHYDLEFVDEIDFYNTVD